MTDDNAQPELARSDPAGAAGPAAGGAPAPRSGPARKKAAPRTSAQKSAAPKTPVRKAPAQKGQAAKAPVPKAPVPKTPAPKKPAGRREPGAKAAATPVPDPNPTAPNGLALKPADPARGAAPAAAEVPMPTPAAAEDVERAWKDNGLAQVLYHDWEAGTYDEKWSISFDDRCITYARDRFAAAVGPEVLRSEPWPYPKTLEIGAGTGFFSLNLKQAGVVDEVHVSDVSAGMVRAAGQNAAALGFQVQGAVAGAEKLPYPDDTFDLVVGHAVVHHIPDVEAALREVLRVLRPGGRFVIAGEPTRVGDWDARRLGRVTWRLTTAVTRMPRFRDTWARSDEELDASSRAAALEAIVDLHTFVPEELAATARRAGARQVRTQTEELLAAFLGWPVRTFEAAVKPEALGLGWAMFAYRSWRRLSAIDRLLHRVVPAEFFYNVGITGIKSRGGQEP